MNLLANARYQCKIKEDLINFFARFIPSQSGFNWICFVLFLFFFLWIIAIEQLRIKEYKLKLNTKHGMEMFKALQKCWNAKVLDKCGLWILVWLNENEYISSTEKLDGSLVGHNQGYGYSLIVQVNAGNEKRKECRKKVFSARVFANFCVISCRKL